MKHVSATIRADDAREIPAGKQPETSRAPSRIVPLTRAVTLGLAATFAHSAFAQEERQASFVAHASTEEPASMHALKDALLRARKALDDPGYSVRERAKEDMKLLINDALGVRNPLPPTIAELLKDEGSFEQRELLKEIRWHAERQAMLLPGRVGSPEAENMPLTRILERQFFMPVRSDDPELAKALETYRGHRDGQTSAETLAQLCIDLGCIPAITQDGLLLQREAGASVRMKDGLFIVEHAPESGAKPTIFASPDQEIILSGDGVSGAALLDITNGSYEHHQPHLAEPLRARNYLQTAVLFTATDPQTRRLSVEHRLAESIGPFTLSVDHTWQEQDGSWSTVINGTHPNDIGLGEDLNNGRCANQMIATARFMARDENGKEAHGTITHMHFEYLRFTIKVHSPFRPAALDARMFTRARCDRRDLP